MNNLKKDKLYIKIYDSRTEMGNEAAYAIADKIKMVLNCQDYCRIIFAAAPSQNEVLTALTLDKSIDWMRVHAFHMDEYIGLPSDAPQGFANFLRKALFTKVLLGKTECIDCTAEPQGEAERYSKLLATKPIDIVVMGIGENGHIAFNDPHVADFSDPLLVKIVSLDEICRMQQVHDGCFASIGDVPKTALTLTIPALMSTKSVFCIVPAKTKANAVYTSLNGPIDESCPASILRQHPNAVMYLDADSARML